MTFRPLAARLAAVAATALLAAPSLHADSAQTRARRTAELAPGVYTIRHADTLPEVHGNTTVVVGEREVLVVDACYTAGAAREDIEQIRKWTDRPVRWVVITHWHNDHFGGARAYVDAYPGVSILAHAETGAMMEMEREDFVPVTLKGAHEFIDGSRKTLSAGKRRDGKALTDAEREMLRGRIASSESMIESMKTFVFQPPTVTFTEGMTLDLGGRTVEVKHVGRGNTGGDVVAWLPKERILATGDLVVHPVPFTYDGYPAEWVRTLERLVALDPKTIVPGHGDVMNDTSYVLLLRDYLRSVVAQVTEQIRKKREVELDAVKKAVDVQAFKEKILGDDAEDGPLFDNALDSLVGIVFHEAKQR